MGIVRDLYYARKMGAGLKLPAPSVALLIKRLALSKILSPAVLKTVTGALLHITDALAKPAEELLVSLSPIQDLHGYSSPWPAGGGKNKLQNDLTTRTVSDVTFTVNADGSISTSGTASATIALDIKTHISLTAGQEYILSGCPSGGSGSSYKLDIHCAGGYYTDYGSGATFTFGTLGDNSENVRIVIYAGANVTGKVFKPMIRLASVSDATFAPYSNICPITGRTGLTVYRTGINIWDEEWERGTIGLTTGAKVDDNTKIRSKNYVPISPNTAYYYKFPGNWRMVYFDSDKNIVEQGNTYSPNIILTSPATAHYLLFALDATTEYDNNIAINYPATDHDYHAYNGNTYASDWTSTAGTVYGGTLDVVTGLLTVDRRFITIDGNSNIGKEATGWAQNYETFYLRITGNEGKNVGVSAVPNIISNQLKSESYNILRSVYGSAFSITFTANATYLEWLSTSATLEEEKARITNNPIEVCYELATPLTYQLTPQEVELLLGENYLWESSGADLSLTYYADGNANTLDALNLMLGNRYVNNHTPEDVSDREALDILLGR